MWGKKVNSLLWCKVSHLNILIALNVFREWLFLCSVAFKNLNLTWVLQHGLKKNKKIGPQILTFYSNGLPLIFFLVFQGFDWRSGSVDPNPWSWMSGSIREGIGKDGCSERDQFSRIQMSWYQNLKKKQRKKTNKWESQNIFFIIRPPSCLSFKGFQG